ncbi:hypothetical protein MASR1M68_11780 [Elusimicrobiota bacterium]
MKKFLMMLVAVALFVPAMASAQINWYGQLDIMGSMERWQNGTNFEHQYSHTNSRLFVGANFDLEENIEANIALMYKNSWGDNYLAGQQVNNANDTGILSKTVLAEANLIFKNLFDNDRLTLKVGKFYYGDKGDSVFYVGLRDMSKWGYSYSDPSVVNTYNSFDAGMDGAQLTYDDQEKLKVDLVYSKMSNENSNIQSEKVNVIVINGKYKINENICVKGYMYDTESTGYPILGYGNRSETLGIKPMVKFGALTASAEFAQQYSSDKSKMFDHVYNDSILTRVNASYQFDLTGMTLTPRVQYLRAGNNFYSILSDVNYGFMSSEYWWYSSLANTESMNVGADWTKGKYCVSFDIFKNGYSFGGDYYWYEYDLIAKYKYTETIEFYAGYAYAVDEYGSDNWWESRTILGVNWKFGSK